MNTCQVLRAASGTEKILTRVAIITITVVFLLFLSQNDFMRNGI